MYREEGYKSVAEVAPSIMETLKTEKLQEVTKKNVAEKIAGMTSLDEIASALNAGRNENDNVSFGGRAYLEPALIGAASVAPEGQICGPVAGMTCVYVFTVGDRQEASFFTEEDAKNEGVQKAQYNAQMIIPVMSEYDNVKDNRARFF